MSTITRSRGLSFKQKNAHKIIARNIVKSFEITVPPTILDNVVATLLSDIVVTL